jgi:hypothetical protein
LEAIKAIFAVIGAICLALFAKRYSDLKRKENELKAKLVQDEIRKTTDANDSMSTDDLMERENKRFWSGIYTKSKKDH